MNLHIVDILQGHLMPAGDGQRISRYMAEVSGMAIQSSDAAGGKHCVISLYLFQGAVRFSDHPSVNRYSLD